MYRKTLIVVLLIGALFLIGCLSFKAVDDPTRFYSLSSVCMQQKCGGNGKIIGVTRVIIPDYLDRCKIVLEIQENEYKIAEFDCWADSMDRGLTRVITENLSLQLPNSSILPAPWRGLAKPDLELHVHVLEFKPQLFKLETLLLVRYYITDVKTGDIIQSQELCATAPILLGPDCYLSVVTSMNVALAQLSTKIACNLSSIK